MMKKIDSLAEEIQLIKSNPSKDILEITDLPFSKPTAYKYEREGLLKITRIRGRSYVMKSDLLDFFKREGK